MAEKNEVEKKPEKVERAAPVEVVGVPLLPEKVQSGSRVVSYNGKHAGVIMAHIEFEKGVPKAVSDRVAEIVLERPDFEEVKR